MISCVFRFQTSAALWEQKFQRQWNEAAVEKFYTEFEPSLITTLSEYTEPISEVIETVEKLREQGLKIGSTTGYTQSMMDVVVPNAKAKGYAPDYYVTPDNTNSFERPYPYMIYRNIEKLKLTATWKVVKVGDTISDIKEAVNAGVWAVGVVIGSSEMSLSLTEFHALSEHEKEQRITKIKQTYFQNGADFTIRSMSELPPLIEKINGLIAEGKKPYSKEPY